MTPALALFRSDYYKFCVVRNSWERYASLYKFQLNRGEIEKGFGKYIIDITNQKARFPFYHWNQIRFGVHLMDDVWQFTSLREHFSKFCNQMGLPQDIELPHLHNEGDYNYRDMYTPTTEELIAKHCQEEITLFKFTF